jgi:hypothetical protein
MAVRLLCRVGLVRQGDDVSQEKIPGPIFFLLLRRYPNFRGILFPPPKPILRSRSQRPPKISEAKKRAQLKLQKEVSEYKSELEATPPAELQALVQQEKAKVAQENKRRLIENEKSLFFNQSSADADVDHWSKAAYWTLEEAVALSLGKDPEIVSWGSLVAIGEMSDLFKASPFIKRYRRTRDLAFRASQVGELDAPTRPAAFLAWAVSIGLGVSPELTAMMTERGIVTVDTGQKRKSRGQNTSETPAASADVTGDARSDEGLEINPDVGAENTPPIFDPLRTSGIATMFPLVRGDGTDTENINQWKQLAANAERNGLAIARATRGRGRAESTWDPISVADWLVLRGAPYTRARVNGILKRNTPAGRDGLADFLEIDD